MALPHHNNSMFARPPRNSMTNRRGLSPLTLMILTAIPSFFLGSLFSVLTGYTSRSVNHASISGSSSSSSSSNIEQRLLELQLLQKKADADRLVKQATAGGNLEQLCAQHAGRALENHLEHDEASKQQAQLFPSDTMGRFAVAMGAVSKQEFTELYDLGVPLDRASAGSEDILMLYSNSKALPNNFGEDFNQIVHLDAKDAVENCEYLNIVLTDHGDHGYRKQCIAIVPQYESYHLQKWMRVNPRSGKLDSQAELQLVSRGLQPNGYNQFAPPDLKADTRKHWQMLERYFANVDAVLDELKPLLKKIAIHNTVIVMVCNFGQSELLMNFVCAARNRGFTISNIIVFTTDKETTELAEALGLAAYYDHRNFGDLPTEAAKRYGDAKFTAMMMAKVICVQLVSMLGYDFLFQDVDIVWYKNPLEYFGDSSLPAYNFDVFFQDDGGHSVRYAPYSANSGFYFVRYNNRTRHFLTSLLMAGDLILKTDSHQQALIATLNEHVSLYGLKAKVLSRDTDEFPGGFQFHMKNKDYMKALFAGEKNAYIFHMSWTLNKDNKLLFFRQMGEWYVKDQCIQEKVDDIDADDLPAQCCAAEPIFSCHYRDKPSMKPCKDSPPIDKGKSSWW